MAKDCIKCGKKIPTWLVMDGVRKNFQRRKYCLDCSPFGVHNTRQLEKARIEGSIKNCCECGKEFCTAKQSRCAACSFRKRVDEKGRKLYGIVGTACWKCGYDRGYEARRVLDFHHLHDKLFAVSGREIAMLSWKRVINEAKKCVLLCCRCHREQQAGLITSEEIDEIYDRKWQDIKFKFSDMV